MWQYFSWLIDLRQHPKRQNELENLCDTRIWTSSSFQRIICQIRNRNRSLCSRRFFWEIFVVHRNCQKVRHHLGFGTKVANGGLNSYKLTHNTETKRGHTQREFSCVYIIPPAPGSLENCIYVLNGCYYSSCCVWERTRSTLSWLSYAVYQCLLENGKLSTIDALLSSEILPNYSDVCIFFEKRPSIARRIEKNQYLMANSVEAIF